MKRIDTITLSMLRLNVFIGFIRTIVDFSKGDAAFMARCGNVTSALEVCVARMEELMLRHKANLLTDDVLAADKKRDELYSYFRDLVRTLKRNPAAEVSEAATLVFKVIEGFGYVSQMNYPAETTAIRALCRDLLENHAAEVEALAQRGMVEQLEAANEEFARLYNERIESMAGFEKNEMENARAATEAAYRSYAETVNAHVILGQGEDLQPVIGLVNATISKFRTVSGQGANTPSAGGQEGGGNLEDSESSEDSEDSESSEDTGNTGSNNGGQTAPTKYTITFTHNGETVSSAQYAEGAAVSVPIVPTGYDWVGVPTYMPGHDVTVTTKWVGLGDDPDL